MGKAFLTFLALVVIVGLACGPFLEFSISHCHQDCDCCNEACNCQPQSCGKQWQPVANLSSLVVVFNISPTTSQKYGYVFFHPDEPVRSIFRPPKQLS